jgi:hypothetical protein
MEEIQCNLAEHQVGNQKVRKGSIERYLFQKIPMVMPQR